MGEYLPPKGFVFIVATNVARRIWHLAYREDAAAGQTLCGRSCARMTIVERQYLTEPKVCTVCQRHIRGGPCYESHDVKGVPRAH